MFDASSCHCPPDCSSMEFSGTVYTNEYADGYAKAVNDSFNFDLRFVAYLNYTEFS